MRSRTWPSGRRETYKLADQGAGRPKTAARVEERGQLSGRSAVSRGRTEDDTVNLAQVVRGQDGVLGVERAAAVHLGEDLLREGLLTVEAVSVVHKYLPELAQLTCSRA